MFKCGRVKKNVRLSYACVFDVVLFSLTWNISWTEWNTIHGVIARLMSKSTRFEITSAITPLIVRHGVQLLINRIYNNFELKKSLRRTLFERKGQRRFKPIKARIIVVRIKSVFSYKYPISKEIISYFRILDIKVCDT